MRSIVLPISQGHPILLMALLWVCFLSPLQADVRFHGQVYDLNGRPLAQARVTVTRQAARPGIAAVSVFTDEAGAFRFPRAFINADVAELPLSASALGYEQVNAAVQVSRHGPDHTVEATVILAQKANQAATAPASAWLHAIEEPDERAQLITNCVNCHQFPSPEVRAYARAVDEVAIGDPQATRLLSWAAIAQYMRLLQADNRKIGSEIYQHPANVKRIYSTGQAPVNARLLGKHMTGRMDVIKGYRYGAPLAVTRDTLIREYAIDQPNTIREALLAGDPGRLWVADIYSDSLIEVDVETGAQRRHAVPADVYVGPKSIFRGDDDAIWITPQSQFNGIIARLDPNTEDWQTWVLRIDPRGRSNIFDLAVDVNHELATDKRGRIWFTDVQNTVLGYFDPVTGALDTMNVPDVLGRSDINGRATSLVMTSDQQYVWYSLNGIGVFGAFNVDTMAFDTSVQLPDHSGPRRMTISDEDILYVALYGSGQLVEYDTRTRQLMGTYDLPDIASAPYAVTWDNVRRVVWVATSNADAIYRFDPQDKSFGVIPLPREGAFLRMISVDQDTGVLVSSYANIAEAVKGPRMALIVDPGDDYPALKQQFQLSMKAGQ